MAGRQIVLATGEYYHIFNRGIARQPVFFSKRDYQRFILTLSYYRFADVSVKLSRYLQLSRDIRDQMMEHLVKTNKTIIEIISYVLMPNHFHLLLRQRQEKGITTFMSKSINSYTKYVNTKNERKGDLLQGVFKAVRIETDEQLMHVSRYIHLNPVVSFVVKDAELFSYPWSSLLDYIHGTLSMVSKDEVMSNFKSVESYKNFLLDHIDYARKLDEIHHLIIEH